jgi:hypothetical protein
MGKRAGAGQLYVQTLTILIASSLAGCRHVGVKQDLDQFETSYDNSLVLWTTELPAAVALE